jgi:hypothetical protein
MENTFRKALTLAAVSAALSMMAVPANAEPPKPLSADALAAMTPERQGHILEPLRLVADAAATVGLGARADIYTQVEMTSDYRAVNVYLTDVSQGPAFVAAVHATNPKADTRLLKVVQGKKTRQQLRKAVSDLVSRTDLPFTVSMAGSSVDGGAIELGVDNPTAAQNYLASPEVARRSTATETPEVRVKQASPSKPVSRWNDSSPFYAGAALGPSSGSSSYCTSGIPAISTWDGRQWLVTAGHCYGVGTNVYTAGGNYIGQVKYNRPDLDAAFIETPTNRWTWDGLDAAGYTRYLNGVRNVAVNDFTCQLGYNSKVVCNIRVVYAGSLSWNVNGTTVWGSYGVPQYGGVVARGGDSGGPVITINDANSRQLNGINSVAWGCDAAKVCTTALGWIDVWSIFNGFAIKLNPS